MPQSTTRFRLAGQTTLTASFDLDQVTSDGGLPWLAEADDALGLCDALAAGIPEWRTGPVRHSRATLVRQRVLQIACGYIDQNDATTLRHDPLLKLVCGRQPRRDADLASQPTLSRLENAVDRRACYRLAQALVGVYLRARERAGRPRHLLLDLDGTDDPVHGQQEGAAYHGYFRQHMDPTRCWSSTARRISSSRPCCGAATRTPATGWSPCSPAWCASSASAGRG
jgi:hypothetical protein